MSLSDTIDKVMRSYGMHALDNETLHSWRCEYYKDIDGPCDCYEDFLAELTAAVIVYIAESKA